MIPAAVLWVWLAPALVFAAVAAIIVLAAAWEWAALAGVALPRARLAWLVLILGLLVLAWWGSRRDGYPSLALLTAFVAFWLLMVPYLRWKGSRNSRAELLLQGVWVLVPAFFALLLVRGQGGGTGLIFALFVVVWGADAGAYFAGRAFGRHKLAPRISPAKTWEGLAGGLAAAAAAGALASLWCPVATGALVVLGVVTAAFSVMGDLVESRLKRLADAKDSGRLIPGHGGVLDRVDSLGAAAPVFAFGLEWVHRIW